MLMVFQTPLADLRPFLSSQLRKEAPHWPLPDTGAEFVRYFGQVRDRKKTDKPFAWEDEKVYANAAGALKLPALISRTEKRSCAFRRLLSDGRAVARFEIGFDLPAKFFTGKSILNLITDLLDLPCLIRGTSEQRRLVHSGKPISRLYARATSTLKITDEAAAEGVIPGRPTVLVQYDNGEIDAMPATLDFRGEGVAFLKTAHGGIDLNAWFLRSDFGDRRNARLVLLRLSAEHQCLKYVLRAVTEGKIDLKRGSPETDVLQSYLDDAEKTFSKASRFGIDQTSFIRITQTYEDLCASGELTLLREKMRTLRPQIAKKVLAIVDRSSEQQPSIAHTGPDFQWRGSIDEVEYQSFFKTGRPPIVVQWIDQVIQKLAPAVCCITIPSLNRCATGFLVAKNLILTNYHVVKETASETLANNLADMQFCFTRSSEPQRVFRLATNPVIASSPKEDLDFALLRTSDDIVASVGVHPFVCSDTARPMKGQGIHILQHPDGGPLKLSTDEDGVTGIYQDSGRVQYVSCTHGGSSGSPCIDGDQNLVAVHHAEVQRSFGSVREGILMAAVFAKIQSHLTNLGGTL